MSQTPNMNIILPTPEVTTGPEWANQIVNAFDTVDGHNHTAGSGVPIPVAGLNINADLEFNSYNATELKSTRYDNQASILTGLFDKNCIYFNGGDLFINNASGTSVQITSGTGLNLSSVGTIGGDYGAPGVTASAVYSNTTKTFTWTQAPTQAAKMAVGDLIVYKPVAGSNPVTIKIDGTVAVGYNFFLPAAAPTSNQVWRQNSTNTDADFVTVQGTSSQITVTHTANAITASLPNIIVTPGSLTTTSTLNSGDDFSVATNKFTVAAASGNTAVAGTLAVTSNTTLTGDLAVNGGDITTTSSTFNLVNATATTLNVGGAATTVSIGSTAGTGTTTVRNALQVSGTANVVGSFSVATNKLTVDASTGNTAVGGTLGVTGTSTLADVNATGTTTVTGTANVVGTLNVTGNGRGIVPLGAIIAMTTGLTGAMSVPASGAVSNGWMRADGSAIPGGNTVSGNTPNLSNSVYLRGSTTYGGTGGNNTTTLTTTELPSHTHTNTFALGGTGVTSGTGTFAAASHNHNMKHVHQWLSNVSGTGASSYVSWSLGSQSTSTTTWSGNPGTGGNVIPFSHNVLAGSGASYAAQINQFDNQTRNYYTAGVLSAPSGTGDTAVTGDTSSTKTVTFSGSIDNTGSGSAFSNEPSYINVIYMIRVN